MPDPAFDLERTFARARELGLCHQIARDERLDGRHIALDSRRLLSFSSCSYLGLELDPRLKRATAEAAERFGVQFSCSRGYVSLALYEELESLLGQIFRAPALVAPTTTLAHLAAMPVLVGPRDALLLDQRVHQSVQMASEFARRAGARVETIWHSHVERLRERVKSLSEKHEKVWYACDGVYSTFGDFAPVAALRELRAEHERMHLYFDDAHGMSWTGRHGSGSVRDALGDLERTVIVSSLNKSFGAAGGVVLLPSASWLARVRAYGGPLNFSGPIQPPLLAAALASARIHLSEEMPFLQEDLAGRIEAFQRRAAELGLAVVSPARTPVRFIGLGEQSAAFEVASRLRARGFYVNVSSFPAVPPQQSGIRLAITRHHRERDLAQIAAALAEEVPAALDRHGLGAADVRARFARELGSAPVRAVALAIETARSIAQVDRQEWQRCLGQRCGLERERLELLERVFVGAPEPEHRWQFHYYTVRDRSGAVVLLTFFSAALWKQDMLAPARLSVEIERRRASDALYLTERVFGMGTLLSEGSHLYLDRERDWRGALALLLAQVERDRQGQSSAVVLRDFAEGDAELDRELLAAGFDRAPLPASMAVEMCWSTREEFLAQLSRRARRFQKREVEPFDACYTREILTRAGPPSERLWRQLYRLYRNVAERSLVLNTFPLPERFFRAALDSDGWELLVLRPAPGLAAGRDADPCAFFIAYQSAHRYVPLIIGLDYAYVESHGLYRQCERHVLERARELGARRVEMGLTSEYEKSRFGAIATRHWAYLRADDLSAQAELASIAAALQGSRS